MQSDSAGLLSLWLTAYRCRELEKQNSRIAPGETHSTYIRSALALNRAAYADCSAFAASCFFETLRESGYHSANIPDMLSSTDHHWVLEALASTAVANISLLYNGAAQTLGFQACLSNRNKDVVRALDQDFLHAAQVKKNKRGDPSSGFSPATLRSCFDSLKSMPYMSGADAPVERPYLGDVDFSDLEKLPHAGLATRALMYRHRLPF